eukprot:GILK01003584.1.p1 GENE.GILK01003584.1~~GILK01003584.1.p1  ORF type:complete len:864 (-),score=235.74 GILK01003584.1:133-2724(-)
MPKKTKSKHRLDKFYHLAKEQGFRSRAAFKLIQLNKKYDLLAKSKVLIDLCAAPGGWMQVAVKYMPVQSLIIGVDLAPIKPVKGCITLMEDITTQKCRSALRKEMKTWQADIVLNDGAPNVGANWNKDAFMQNELTLSALKLATEFLRPGGTFVTKIFRSKDYNALLWVFHQLFGKVEATKPQASRNASAEIFVVCMHYKAPDKIDPKLLDAKYAFMEVEEDQEGEKKHERRSLAELVNAAPKKQRGGYEDGVMTLRKVASVADFIAAENPQSMLLEYNVFEFDDRAAHFLENPLTTEEIKICCQDLKVLGKRDYAALMKWRFKLHRQSAKKKKENKTETAPRAAKQDEAAPEEPTKISVQEQLDAMLTQQQAKERRAKKKRLEQKVKAELRQKMSFGSLDAPMEEDLFSLDAVSNEKVKRKVLRGAYIDDEDSDSDEQQDDEEEEGEDVEYVDKLAMDLDAMYEEYKQRNVDRTNQEKKQKKETRRQAEVMAWTSELTDIETRFQAEGEENGVQDSDDDSDDDDDDEEEDDEDMEDGEEANGNGSAARTKSSQWFKQSVFQGIDDEDAPTDMSRFDGNSDEEEAEVDAYSALRAAQSGVVSDDDDRSDDDNISEVDVPELEKTDKQKRQEERRKLKDREDKRRARFSKKKKDDPDATGDFEIAAPEPELEMPDYDSDTMAEMLSIGKLMLRKKARRELIDDTYNRYTFTDHQALPAWFQEDEGRHNKPQKPVTKEMVAEMKQKFNEINSRPSKKVMEAKARKKMKTIKKLEKIKQKAKTIVDSTEMTEGTKARAVEKLYKKEMREEKKEKTYVVARSLSGGKAGVGAAKKAGRRNIKLVDPRLKKDARAAKRKEQKSKKRKR